MSKGKAVRITDEAHVLLAEKAEEYNVSQKEIASEAILMLHKKEERQRRLVADVAWLEKELRDNRHALFGAFALGTIIAGCLGIFIGVML